MAKKKASFAEVVVVSAVTIVGFGILAVFVIPNVLAKMGNDIVDAEKDAARMSALIKDTPECAQYKDRFMDLGRSAKTINGAYNYRMIEVKNEANKVGCSK